MDSELTKIKEIREATNLSFAQIKKALTEAGGDADKALKILAEQGASIAAKKSSRSTGEGVVEAYIHATKKTAGVVELFCETDFVAKNPLFSELAHDIAMHIVAMDPATPEDLLAQPFIKDQSLTIQDLVNQAIAKLGENIKVGRFVRYSI